MKKPFKKLIKKWKAYEPFTSFLAFEIAVIMFTINIIVAC